MSIAVALGAMLFLADMVLGAFLTPGYYLSGPVIVRIRRTVPNGMAVPPTSDELQHTLRSFLLGSLVFADFGGYTYGFRRSLLHGSGLLQSVVVFSPYESVVEVQGRLGWFMLGAAGVMLFVFGSSDSSALLLLPLVFGGLALFDAFQCLRVASAAQRLWAASEEHPAA